MIKVAFAGVNPADWKIRAGHLDVAPFGLELPLTVGLDAAGTVVATGEKVTKVKKGDRVVSGTNLFSNAKPGSYAQYLVVNEQRVAIVPDHISLESAATIPTAGITAWQALFASDKGGLSKGQGTKILINGASGGVGSFAVQLAKWAGAEVAATCSSANLEYVKSLGADLLIDYKTQNIRDELIKWSSNGIDLIVDVISADSLEDPVGLLRKGGKLVSVATLTDDGDVETSIAEAKERGVTKVLAFMNDLNFGEEIQQLIDIVKVGNLKLPPTEAYDLDNVVQAHEKLETGRVRGKLVLRVK
ncbi:NADP-dependent oxidoreductase [Parasedimentitalea marina]|uniref:NADP-dependent oxidoreductase n=1 Tax=Parasedimentitalea marina TaxID=2483033 RepID=A0A3T0N3T8_9RHOB|nr:NADP-dependent oxidoreductase [Parasedimentitalea marina]AZV78696.1 NADP-dependent oxidoreductase [Parasedimentitalea marina]